jgi:exonuclease III
MKTNHGGVCLFYRSSLSARHVQLPVYKSKLEVLAVFIQAARRNVLVIVFYWPGSADINNAFFEDFDDVLEHAATFACPIVVLGDVNIHIDAVVNPHAVRFQSLLDSYGLIQNVSTPTRGTQILDVIITR